MLEIINRFISWLNANGTAALVFVTFLYVILAYSLLKETQKDRKINAIEKKLEKFYIPLQQHILKHKDEVDREKVKDITAQADFMKYIHLCHNREGIADQLKELIDTTSSGGANRLRHIEKRVNKDIKTLEEELDRLQGISIRKLLTWIWEKCQSIFKKNKWKA